MSRPTLIELRRIHRLAWGGLWLIGSSKSAVALAAAVGLGLALCQVPGMSSRLWQTLVSLACLLAGSAATHRWLWPLWRADKSLHATATAVEQHWRSRRGTSSDPSPDPAPPAGSLLGLIDLSVSNSPGSREPLREAARRQAERYWRERLSGGSGLALWRVLAWSGLGLLLWGGLISLALLWPQSVGRSLVAIVSLGGLPASAENAPGDPMASLDREATSPDANDQRMREPGRLAPPHASVADPEGTPLHGSVWDPRQLEAWWQMQRWLNEQTEPEVGKFDQAKPSANRLIPLSALQLELAEQLERATGHATDENRP